jgi:lipopolysaccharide export system protein LptA
VSTKKPWLFYAALIIPSGTPDIEISGFNMVESLFTQRSMELRAKKAQLFTKERVGSLETIQAKVWSSQGNIYEIQAEQGALDTSDQNFRTEGETTITTPDSYKFQTQNVTYIADKKHLTGIEPVHLTPLALNSQDIGLQKFSLKGVGLFVDMANDLFRIENNVRAQQVLSSEEKLDITSQKFEFNSIKNIARFFNNVQVKHPRYTMNGYLLDLFFNDREGSEELTLKEMYLRASSPQNRVQTIIGTTQFRSHGFRILFDKDSEMERTEALGSAEADLGTGIFLRAEKLYSFVEDSVQKIRMEENVKITTPNRTAECGEAIYIPDTGDFILEKVASLSDEDQIIRGERILFSTQHNRLKVEKASGSLNRDSLKQ